MPSADAATGGRSNRGFPPGPRGSTFGSVRRAQQGEGIVKRSLTVGFVGAVVLTTMLLAPGAEASVNGHHSTSCAFVMRLKFTPGLHQGLNEQAFIRLKVHLRGCSGGKVQEASGWGGSIGDLRCDSGQITGRAAAKAQLDWNTGDTSALNFFFVFQKSRLRGQVVDGLFKGERIQAKDFSFTPVTGDCGKSPLDVAKVTGKLKL
jgi:hypothetical protein